MFFISYRRTWALVIVLLLTFDVSQTFCQQPLPPKDDALLVQGKDAEAQGNFSQAMSSYNALLHSDPNNSKALFQIGLLQGQSGNLAGAVSAFQRAIKADPKFAEAHYNLGLAIIAESKNPEWPRALAEFKAALRLRPHYPEAMNMVGVCMLETGSPAIAIAQFRSALLLNPDSAELHFNLGRALESTENNSGAYIEYLAALKHKTAYPEAEVALGNLSYLRADYASAISCFKTALTHNPDLEAAHYGLAKSLRAQDKTAEAQFEFQQAKALLERQSDAIRSSHLSNESLEFAKNGNFAAAVQAARQALALEPESAIPHYNLGLLLADSGYLHDAIHELRNAISLAPLQGSFYLNLSRMQEKLNDRAGAADSLRHAIVLMSSTPVLEKHLKTLGAGLPIAKVQEESLSNTPFPYGAITNTSAAHFAFATQLSDEGDLQGAIGELLRALAQQPADTISRYNLAIAYMQIGEDEKSELELRKVLLLTPDSVQAHIALGTILLQTNDVINAAAEFHRVLALEPNNREAQQLFSQCQLHMNHQEPSSKNK